MPRACQFCRRRKIRCDAAKPSCTTCRNTNRTCVYHSAPPKPRPSTALLNAVQDQKAALEGVLARLINSDAEERRSVLDSLSVGDGKVSLPRNEAASATPTGRDADLPGHQQSYPTPSESRAKDTIASDDDEAASSEDEGCVSNFLSTGEGGQAGIFSSTSAIRVASPATITSAGQSASSQPYRYQLIASAAMGRQHELQLRSLNTIRGVPAELALHLLDLHWNRQHHTFLLTYRPAFMRELVDGGPYCSDLLLNAVFACASKFSERIELRSEPADPESAGRHFFLRCDELLLRESLLSQSRVPTIIALLMLGSTFIARGLTSKGWLYTGYALRMVYDLGLHLDSDDVGSNPEEVEIRRRVFWGAFICEKLQSLYLGRPVVIGLRDAHVSRDFMDTFEELEPWTPYVDPKAAASCSTVSTQSMPSTFIYSVSVFQQLCLLSKVMTKIINKIYFVGATARKTFNEIKPIDDILTTWYRDLPSNLAYEPWTRGPMDPPLNVAPNRIILLTTYHFLVILLHRPFISNPNSGMQPNSISAHSWKRCTTAARNITSLALSYRSTYPLRKSNYLLSYAVYVACTIHVLNAAALGGENSPNADSSLLLGASLRCLDELAVPNSGVADTTRIIRKLMAAKGVQEFPLPLEMEFHVSTPQDFDNSSQMFAGSPTFDEFAQMQTFSDFELSGHDLLFGFMNENFSPANFNIC